MLTRHRLIRSLLGLLRRGRRHQQRAVAEPPIFLAPF
jgi:hypothetical protein